MRSPCAECEDRWIDIEKGTRCHSECEKFKIFKTNMDKMNKSKRTEAFKRDVSINSVRKACKGKVHI